ncbi:D-alanyl-D-alanine carboxypeptidase [Sanguibacter keddieii DSM 10542]|uniref:D-alanyl-D-alanine carboxypeptidase n=1 Tax=Sanguibacter keddieii (strain ATCC 51767 / DSM 10542 / NCFB 3025 / ST-74) TaxID=446469 RepID=D1BBW9_SANKS|nr:D-alanyl-D-alanine carboxypeptidase family protein [Sanguibacter keddieii]ACZ20749.1 D-alanyl-D-alanine carboxypeptidase [Sanguibacter keddieii DSM 10542]
MTSSQATSRPRIPRRGSAESTPAALPAEPPRRRTTVRANAAHVVPFDTAWREHATDRSVDASDGIVLGTFAPDAPVADEVGWHIRAAVGADPVAGPSPTSLHASSPRPTRRTALLVSVPVVVLTLGLAAVALGVSSSVGGPAAAGAPGASSGPLGGAAAPAATGLDAELERRFAGAVEAAAADGVEMTLTSGWRSAEDQAALVEMTLAKHGSAEEAHRWVLPPERSAHVAGLAIDVGPTDGALWLEQHGSEHGLCRVYANELWHFEPVVEPGGTCPDLLPDSSSGWDGIDG